MLATARSPPLREVADEVDDARERATVDGVVLAFEDAAEYIRFISVANTEMSVRYLNADRIQSWATHP